ncbi:alpha/beta fold hydrolase [Lysinibacillus sp. BW-2-10]|uniref:alpha/beta fold hydrolase n=1 Tax=Lysinibacillus sp. BW-2-10 TaxID=2590030 RepID=UPI00117F7D76|nr:alpha/beta hydrolase [Lysinibacillus sp. BW-2-10]TSI07388.1 alpha/beta hydrolase [Lysinibacillus sp. BW-2-10]
MQNVIKRNNVKVMGQGEQTILFAHGFGCDQKMWQYIASTFAMNYRVVLFDYVGSGNSDITAYESEKYSTLHGYAQDVLDIIEELNLQHVLFIGHSISSMIGMYAAIQQPQYFDKLIMIGPSPCYLNDPDGYVGGFEKEDIKEILDLMEMNFTGWASFMAPFASSQPDDATLTRQLKSDFVSTNPRVAREFAEVTFFSDCRSKLSFLKVPTLIIQCSNDSIVPIEVGEYLQKHIQNSTLLIMNAKGHYPHISQPLETIEIINDYLN